MISKVSKFSVMAESAETEKFAEIAKIGEGFKVTNSVAIVEIAKSKRLPR